MTILKGSISYNDVLPLIHSIVKKNKYVKVVKNDTDSTFIYHSEHEKNTCNDCKSLDNAIFKPGDIMIIPPIHPNCKCELEEIKQPVNNENKTEYKTCDCLNVIRNIYQQLEDILKEANSLIENKMSEENANYIEAVKKAESIKNGLDIEHSHWKNEIGKHQPECDKKPDETCAEIHNKYKELKDVQGKFMNERTPKVFDFEKSVKDNLISFIKTNAMEDTKNLYSECGEQITHTEEECYYTKQIEELNQTLKATKSLFEKYKNDFQEIVKFRNDFECKLLSSYKDFIQQKENIRTKTCDCANSGQIRKTGKEIATEIATKAGYGMTLAGANLNDAMNDFAAAKKNKNAKVYDSRPEFLDDNINKIMDNAEIPKNSRGVVYNSASNQANAIFKTNEIQNFIRNDYKKLKEGFYKNQTKNMEFRPNINSINDTDAYLAIQHCAIYNAYIDKNDYFDAVIIDYYDFDRRDDAEDVKHEASNGINNWAKSMQEKGYLEKFFVVYHIRGLAVVK